MIDAYAIYSDRSCRHARSAEDAIQCWTADCQAIWIDIEAPSLEDMEALKQPFSLDPKAIDDCLGGEQRPRLDEFDDQAFFVLYGAIGPEADPEFSPRKLAIFFGPRHVITVHEQPLQTVQKIRSRAQKQTESVLGRGTDFLLYTIIDSMADNYLLMTENYDRRLDALEEASLSADSDPSILTTTLTLRKDMLELRRIAGSQREMLQPVVAGELDYISEKVAIRFGHVRDHLSSAIETIDNLRELLHGVRDNYHAALAERMNSIMKVLTIFASLFLPLSLIAGIYGMNTALWPSENSPYLFWIIIGAMGVVILGMLSFFKYKRWF